MLQWELIFKYMSNFINTQHNSTKLLGIFGEDEKIIQEKIH